MKKPLPKSLTEYSPFFAADPIFPDEPPHLRSPVKGIEYTDDLARPTAEQLLTLPRFITGEIFFGVPVPFKVPI